MLIADPTNARAVELVELHPVCSPIVTITRKQRELACEYTALLDDRTIIEITNQEVAWCRAVLATVGARAHDSTIRRAIQKHYPELRKLIEDERANPTGYEAFVDKIGWTYKDWMIELIVPEDGGPVDAGLTFR